MFAIASRYTVLHEEVITRLDEQILDVNLRMAELADIMAELSRYQRESQARMDRNQEEIRRIWEYLSSQSGNGRSSK